MMCARCAIFFVTDLSIGHGLDCSSIQPFKGKLQSRFKDNPLKFYSSVSGL